MPRWDVHLLERAAGTEGTPYPLGFGRTDGRVPGAAVPGGEAGCRGAGGAGDLANVDGLPRRGGSPSS